MSRITNCITFAAGTAAGLFLAALVSSATATADTTPPTVPGVPGLLEQVVASTVSIPQQLLQSTSALTGTQPASAAPSAPAPLATATLNMPPGLAPAAPEAGTAAGVPGLAGLPGNLSSVLPFPMPSLGGTNAPAVAPSATLPGAFLPSATLPGAFLPSAPAVAPVPSAPTTGLLIPGLP